MPRCIRYVWAACCASPGTCTQLPAVLQRMVRQPAGPIQLPGNAWCMCQCSSRDLPAGVDRLPGFAVWSRVVLHCAMLQWRCGLVCLLACSSTCLTGSRTRKACPPSAAGHTACAAVKCRVRDPCSCRGCVGVKDADGMACWWLRVGQGVAPCLAASWQGASGGQAPSQTMFWVLCVCHTGRGERAAAVQSVRASAGALVDGCLLLESGPVLSAACAMFGGASNRALTRALAAQRLQALAGTSACTQRSITCWGGGCQLRPTPPPASVHVCFAAHTE